MNHDIEMNALTPMEDLDSTNPAFEVYKKALDSAFNNPQICNLALSGSLGAGKSSIIRSYDRYRNGERRFLYISLIDFSQLTKNKKSGKNDQPQLEYSLLNQIQSYCTSDDLPEGSIAGIPEKFDFLDFWARGFTLLFLCAFVLTFHEKFGALASVFGVAEPLRSNLHPMLYLLAAIVLCGFLYRILLRCLPYLRISKLLVKTKVADAEVNLGKERTTLDAHKFELAYILEQIGEKHDHTVVFEDLERLDADTAIDIMSKLRELNTLTNNHIRAQGGSTPIRFLYAIGDSTMPAPYRTKFYDCIIPVVPVSHPLNSRKKFEDMLDKLTISNQWRNTLCDALSDAFVDYRTLLSLQNEFQVLRELREVAVRKQSTQYNSSASCNDTYLLAITAYKILLPECFERALSPQGNGILPAFSSAAEQDELERYLEQHDRKKAVAAVRNMFDRGLLDKVSMRLIIGESVLIEQWLQTIRYALDRDTFNEDDEARITDIIDALEDAVTKIKPALATDPYLAFHKTLTERLGKLTDKDSETQLILLVNSLSVVSKEDWTWGTPEIARRYATCLTKHYNVQALPESSQAKHLKNISEKFPGNEEMTLRYAKSLVNLSCIQKLPECDDTVDLLKKLREVYPDNQEIVLCYAMGLVNLSREQKLPERKTTIGLLKELRKDYPENHEIVHVYARGLVNLSCDQNLAERKVSTGLLKELREAYSDNQEIALEYAKGLFNLACDQDLDERKVTIDLLKKLREDYPENQEIALVYAMGLVNLSYNQKLLECTDTVDLLKELREDYPENQEIALRYANGLFNLSNAQELTESLSTINLMKDLLKNYPENLEIAQQYAMGLVNLSAKQELAERNVTIDILKELHEEYPHSQQIALEYAMGLVNLSNKQKLPKCADTVDLLKRLYEVHPKNQDIAVLYARGLFNLAYAQDLTECKVTIDLLKKLWEGYPENQDIALQYANGLFNLSNAQELTERKATHGLLKKLRDAYPENQKIAQIYDEALDLLS